MAALDSDDVRRALKTKLGCVEQKTDHYRYVLYDEGRIVGTTKVPLGAKHTIGDALIAKMARQLRIGTSSNFVQMVSCAKSREDSLAIIRSVAAQSS